MTYVGRAILFIFLTPANFCRFSFTQAKHTQHTRYPLSHCFHKIHVHFWSLGIDIYICSWHKLSQNIQGEWCIERIAQCCSKRLLALIETMPQKVRVSKLNERKVITERIVLVLVRYSCESHRSSRYSTEIDELMLLLWWKSSLKRIKFWFERSLIAHIHRLLNVSHFSGHKWLREVHFRVPSLCKECQS